MMGMKEFLQASMLFLLPLNCPFLPSLLILMTMEATQEKLTIPSLKAPSPAFTPFMCCCLYAYRFPR